MLPLPSTMHLSLVGQLNESALVTICKGSHKHLQVGEQTCRLWQQLPLLQLPPGGHPGPALPPGDKRAFEDPPELTVPNPCHTCQLPSLRSPTSPPAALSMALRRLAASWGSALRLRPPFSPWAAPAAGRCVANDAKARTTVYELSNRRQPHEGWVVCRASLGVMCGLGCLGMLQGGLCLGCLHGRALGTGWVCRPGAPPLLHAV